MTGTNTISMRILRVTFIYDGDIKGRNLLKLHVRSVNLHIQYVTIATE